MKNKSLIILIVALVAVIAVAAIVYPTLSQKANDEVSQGEITLKRSKDKNSSETENGAENLTENVTKDPAGSDEAYEMYEEIITSDKNDIENLTEDVTKNPAVSNETYEMYEGISILDKYGNEIALADLLGKPIIINFWTTWCTFCVSEMPHFQDAFEEYGNEIQFLFINPDENFETINKFMNQKGYTFPTYVDKGSTSSYAFGVSAFPTTAAIDAEGNIKYLRAGMITADALEKIIDLIK